MTTPPPPVAPRIPSTRHHHGDEYDDDLNWLRNRSDPRVIAHIEAENAYSQAMTQSQEPLRQAIFKEIKERATEADLSLPSRHGGWWHYSRTIPGGQYPIYCRIPVLDPTDWSPPAIPTSTRPEHEQILLDCNKEAAGHAYFSLGSAVVSDDGQLLAYGVDTTGDEYYTLRIKDLRNNQLLTDTTTEVARNLAWTPDGTRVFYARLDASWRPYQLMMHVVGTDPTTDTVVYHETSGQMRLAFRQSADQTQLVISSGNSSHSETLLLNLTDPDPAPTLLIPRTLRLAHAVEPLTSHGQRQYLIRHNHHAVNNMVSLATLDQLGTAANPQDWTPIIPHEDNVRIGGIAVTKTHLLLTIRRSATRGVRIHSGQVPGSGVAADPSRALFRRVVLLG